MPLQQQRAKESGVAVMDRALFAFTAFGLALNGPFLRAPSARAAAAAMAIACAVLAACTAHKGYRGRARVAAAVGYRLAFAAVAQFSTAGGRWVPRAVTGWGPFLAGRALPLMFALQSALLQLDGAHTVATIAACVAIYAAGQASVCPALLDGYLGSDDYFTATAVGLRAVTGAAAAALGVREPGVRQLPSCSAHACQLVMTALFAAAGAVGAIVGGSRVPGGGVRATTALSALALLLLWGAIDMLSSLAPCPAAAGGAFLPRARGALLSAAARWNWASQLAAWPARVAADARSLAALVGSAGR